MACEERGPDWDTMVTRDPQPGAGLSPAGTVGRGSDDAVYCGYTEGTPKLQRDRSLSLLAGALWLGSQATVRLGQQCGGAWQRVCNRRASAWQDQRPGEKGATARQALILHSTWKQKEKVSPMQSPSVTGLQVNSAVTVSPLLACPSRWVRLGRWADGLKRGPSRPPCDTPPPPIGHGGAPVPQVGSAEPTCPASEDACSGGLARAT